MGTVNELKGTMEVHNNKIFERKVNHPDLMKNGFGVGRALFDVFRNNAGPAKSGASVFNF